MQKLQVTLGVDIGKTNTLFSFVDFDGECVKTVRIPTRSNEPAEQLVIRLQTAVESAFEHLQYGYEIIGVGIGAPNGNYLKGTIETPPGFNWETVPVVDLVKRYFQLPAAVTDSGNTAALAEMVYGSAQRIKDFIAIHLGTELWSGIVVNGRIVHGSNGRAGTLAHMTAISEGRFCICGKMGCLQTYTSSQGILQTARILLDEDMTEVESSLRAIPPSELAVFQIASAALNADPVALNVFDYVGRILGMKLADALLLLTPQAVFFSGELIQNSRFILDPVNRSLDEFLPPSIRHEVKLLPSGLQYKNIAVLGASALILNELKSS